MAYGHIAAVDKITLSSGSATNLTVVLTIDNILCFTSNITGITKNANTYFGQLPASIPYPSSYIDFCIPYYENSTYITGIFYITPTGYIGTRQALSNATVYMNGCNINLNNDFYNDTIGNNDMSVMTTPLSAR